MGFESDDWIRLVKRTRENFNVSIVGAHDLNFADKEVRRLVARRINCDARCRKMTHQDMRQHGASSRFVREGDRIKFRRRDGQMN